MWEMKSGKFLAETKQAIESKEEEEDKEENEEEG